MSHKDTTRLRYAEAVALIATVCAVGLTALLEPATAAVESNPFAAGLLDTVGWTGAGIVAVVGEVALFSGWRRLSARGYARAALGAGAGIAAVGVADVLVNLLVLSRVGLPETARIGEYGGVTAIVALVAFLAYFRGEVRVALEIVAYTFRDVTSVLSGVERQQVAAGGFAILLVLSSLGGLTGSISGAQTASAGQQIDSISTGHNNKYVEYVPSLDRIFVMGYDGSNNYLYAYDADTGSQLWQSDPISSMGGVEYSEQSGRLYAATGNLSAINPDDGSTIWTYSPPYGPTEIAVDDQNDQIYAGGFRYLHAVNFGGSPVWTKNSSTFDNNVNVEWGYGTLVVRGEDANGNPITSGYGSGGSEKWNKSVETYAAEIYDGDVYVVESSGTLQKRDLSDGSKIWQDSIPTDTGYYLVSSAASDTIYADQSGDGNTFVYDSSGNRANTISDSSGVLGSPTTLGAPSNGKDTIWFGKSNSLIRYETNQDAGVSVSGSVSYSDGSIDGSTVELRQSGSVVKATTTNSTGGYTFSAVSDGDYTVRASASGYQNASKSITVAGAPVTADLTLNEEGTYKQTFELEDNTGAFPDDETSLVLERYDPALDTYSTVSSASLDGDGQASFRLTEGLMYRVTARNVIPNQRTAAEAWSGIVASDDLPQPYVLETTPLPEPEDITTATPTATPNGTTTGTATATTTPTEQFPWNGDADGDGIPNWFDPDYDGDGVPNYEDPDYPSASTVGPLYLSQCQLNGQQGARITYFDPSYETEQLEYEVIGPDGAVYNGTKEFNQPIGRWTECVSGTLTGNVTDEPNDEIELIGNATNTNGTEISYNSTGVENTSNGLLGGGGGGIVDDSAGSGAPIWTFGIPAVAAIGYAIIRRRRSNAAGGAGNAGQEGGPL